MEKLSNMRHMLPEIVICLAGAYVVPAPRAIGTAKTVLDATSEGRPWGFIFSKSRWDQDAAFLRIPGFAAAGPGMPI